jgi:hypothetical protein
MRVLLLLLLLLLLLRHMAVVLLLVLMVVVQRVVVVVAAVVHGVRHGCPCGVCSCCCVVVAGWRPAATTLLLLLLLLPCDLCRMLGCVPGHAGRNSCGSCVKRVHQQGRVSARPPALPAVAASLLPRAQLPRQCERCCCAHCWREQRVEQRVPPAQ